MTPDQVIRFARLAYLEAYHRGYVRSCCGKKPKSADDIRKAAAEAWRNSLTRLALLQGIARIRFTQDQEDTDVHG